MNSLVGDEPRDAERWVYLHEAELVGADCAIAVDLIREAGLTSEVAHYRGSELDPSTRDFSRVRLLIVDDGKVRWARSG
jgi:hypothetical protein